jgi:glutaredoxin|tara:strand:+ start:1425 stop:1658 length:234 start_codon:yes stop_codon:yes gene_type:complete
MITIYGKTACGFCDAAKQLCETRGYKYKYKQLDKDFTREDIIKTFPGARTFPQIIVNDDKIGGYEQLIQYIEETPMA